MSLSPALLAIVVVIMMGSAVIWANPHRTVNRVFFSTALHVSTWLFCVHQAVDTGESRLWIQLASLVGAFFPAHLWIVKEATIVTSETFWKTRTRRSMWWITGAALLAALCFSDAFMLPSLENARPNFGPGYYAYMIGVLCLYAILCRETVLQIRSLTGISRLELQIMLLGGSATAGTVILLMALRAIVGAVWPIQLQPIIVMAFYACTVIAITTHRIFDARQILRVGLQKIVLVVVSTIVAYGVDWCAKLFMPQPLDLLVTMGVVLWFATSLNSVLQRALSFYPDATDARQAIFAAARRETRVEKLEKALITILKGWGQSEHALLIWDAKEGSRNAGQLAGNTAVLDAMSRLRWVTPERLMREKSTPEREAVAAFLKSNHLGVLVIAEGATLITLIGVGVSASRRPFTYPQVAHLMELGSIIESSLELAHFSLKVQHAEQLATVGLLGASLAHEIRNPLVSIKTFVQLLPSHHQDAAFRKKFFRLITDEVDRIDQLTEQLLGLASPRAYAAQIVNLHPILRASLELVTAKAAHKNVDFITAFEASPDAVFTDPSAAKQVMLNLCFNAIQAIETNSDDNHRARWVRIATRNTIGGVEIAVADSGPGVPPEIRPRLFQPFQTTKSTGFGLGLAICSDILANVNASISIDPTEPGCGATFRVIFPCQPSSS